MDDFFILKFKDKVSSHSNVMYNHRGIESEEGIMRTFRITLRNKKAKGIKLVLKEEVEIAV